MELVGIENFALAGLVVGSFIATSMDNLLILVVLLGANAKRRPVVLFGFLASSIAVLCLCAAGLVIRSILNAGLIGYLGLMPLLLGCHMLYRAWFGGEPQEGPQVDTLAGSAGSALWLSTFMLMLGNSGDSIAVFLPLLAETRDSGTPVVIASYLVMALAWAGLSYAISGHRVLAERLEKRAEKIIPWVMIGAGVYILMDTATDSLV